MVTRSAAALAVGCASHARETETIETCAYGAIAENIPDLPVRSCRIERGSVHWCCRRCRATRSGRFFNSRGFVFRRSIIRLGETGFVRSAIDEQVDLSAFREKPTPTAIIGLVVIGLSYIVGWPAIALLGIVAIKLQEPLLAVIGGPLLYGLSHLVFILGMYLCGAFYSMVMVRWLTRVSMEKLLVWAKVKT